MVRAAVLSLPGERLHLADLELLEPGPGQVRVRIAATGVCHSDLSLARGALRQAGTTGDDEVGTERDDLLDVDPREPRDDRDRGGFGWEVGEVLDLTDDA